jgi:hypothetical protein
MSWKTSARRYWAAEFVDAFDEEQAPFPSAVQQPSPDGAFWPGTTQKPIDGGEEYIGCFNIWEMTDAF